MSLPDLPSLAALLAAHPRIDVPALPGRRNHLHAGVLVPLRFVDGDLEVVLTERVATLRHHGGEVSFPGGKPDPEDRDLEHTALREAEEEIGLRGARVLGRLSSIPLYTSDFRLEPFVALVPADAVFVRGDQLAVFVSLGQGRYERRFAQLRTAGPQWWHVVQGLKPGEKVVIGGTLFLNQLLDAAQ